MSTDTQEILDRLKALIEVAKLGSAPSTHDGPIAHARKRLSVVFAPALVKALELLLLRGAQDGHLYIDEIRMIASDALAPLKDKLGGLQEGEK